jgi:hypothetical protein
MQRRAEGGGCVQRHAEGDKGGQGREGVRRVTSQDDAKRALGSVLFRHERTEKKEYLSSFL